MLTRMSDRRTKPDLTTSQLKIRKTAAGQLSRSLKKGKRHFAVSDRQMQRNNTIPDSQNANLIRVKIESKNVKRGRHLVGIFQLQLRNMLDPMEEGPEW